ncbi:KUP/HAK/KT family potassium transporter [Burkholderia sp. 8Y]|uniref:KUP/HAK/KT family potassium transporter n=1 Tax=Burkholderia sp. 8Y TaxID=2653133 RepID=UPI003FA40E43
MATWHRGSELAQRHASHAQPVADFLRDTLAGADAPARVQGTAIYPGSVPGATPSALTSNVRHNRVLNQTTVIFTNRSESAPRVDEHTRVEVRDLGAGCYEVILRHGFTERPNLPRLLESLNGQLGDWRFDHKHTTYFLPRDDAMPGCSHGQMSRWRERPYGEMSVHATSSAEYFGLRSEDVVELGVQVVL